MIWNFGNCMIPRGSGTNFMYEGARCVVSCSIQNISGATQVVNILNVFAANTFGITDILIDSGPPTFPFFVSDGDSIALQFSIISSLIGDTDSIEISIDSTFGLESQKFDFEVIDLATNINLSSIDFGDIPIGTSVSVPITIQNTTICCYIYGLSTECAEVTTTSPETAELCKSDGQTIGVIYTPPAIGNLDCSLIFSNESNVVYIPMTGRGISDRPGLQGNDVSVKRTIVDCPTSDCRLANGQPGFAQSTKNSINQISRATSPKGGAGRGTNFRK
jgi:hypothetical protein